MAKAYMPTHLADTAVRHADMDTLPWHTPPTVHMHTKALTPEKAS